VTQTKRTAGINIEQSIDLNDITMTTIVQRSGSIPPSGIGYDSIGTTFQVG